MGERIRRWWTGTLPYLLWASVAYAHEDNRSRALRQAARKRGRR